MTDKEIVKALRMCGTSQMECPQNCPNINVMNDCMGNLLVIAADAIERLTAEVERLTRERDAALLDGGEFGEQSRTRLR